MTESTDSQFLLHDLDKPQDCSTIVGSLVTSDKNAHHRWTVVYFIFFHLPNKLMCSDQIGSHWSTLNAFQSVFITQCPSARTAPGPNHNTITAQVKRPFLLQSK